MDIGRLECDPEMIARYIHFYKTGNDINNPDHKDSSNSIPPNKKQKKKHIPPAVLESRRTIQICCRDNNLPLALQTFHKALRDLVRMEAQVFYQLLNLCEGTFAMRMGVHVGTPKPKKGDGNNNKIPTSGDELARDDDTKPAAAITNISLDQRLHHARQIHALLSSLNIPLIEQAYTALIRLSSRAGDFDRAEKYLDEAEKTQQCKVKLRMYSSLLRAYCGELGASDDEGLDKDVGGAAKPITQERLVQALKVWKRMYDSSGGPSTGCSNYIHAKKEGDGSATLFGEGIAPKITLTECEYSALITCATKLHDEPVIERVLSDVADQVLVPGLNTIEVILNWFRSDVGNSAIDKADDGSTAQHVSSALDHITLPPREDPPLGPVTNEDGKGWNIYRDCTIDSTTAKLTLGAPQSKTQYRLKPVELTDRAWNAMRDMNSSIVLEGQVEGNVSQYQGGGKGKKRPRGSNGGTSNSKKNNNNHSKNVKSQGRVDAWNKFETFIQEHPPYNIVIDGANVGYFQQNFAGSPKHVDYQQIDWLVRHLLEQPSSSSEQHHIILFLHERHFSPRLTPSWAYPIIQSWDGNESPYNRLTVYRTPSGMNDDWYWMHAALINGGKAGKPSVLAITNDEMRDHHFQMLAQGSFLRWKERHQVHFDFGPWNENSRRREVLLQYPNSYSRRIQQVDCEGADEGVALIIPLPKKGDEGRFADGLHVAENGVPSQETYIVIQKML
ncbi:hypothetical protein ACHAXR_004495 [Thalassiosira sp. AJA248-18]